MLKSTLKSINQHINMRQVTCAAKTAQYGRLLLAGAGC
jgi:hypothetical protein